MQMRVKLQLSDPELNHFSAYLENWMKNFEHFELILIETLKEVRRYSLCYVLVYYTEVDIINCQ